MLPFATIIEVRRSQFYTVALIRAYFIAFRRRDRVSRPRSSPFLPASHAGYKLLFPLPTSALKVPRNGFDRFGTLLCRDPRALRRSFLTGRSCLYSPRATVSRHHPPFMGIIMGAQFHYYPRHPGDHQPGKPRRSSPPALPSHLPPRGLPFPSSL
jgi:hypothetical protein